jgi:hypothetical protein
VLLDVNGNLPRHRLQHVLLREVLIRLGALRAVVSRAVTLEAEGPASRWRATLRLMPTPTRRSD